MKPEIPADKTPGQMQEEPRRVTFSLDGMATHECAWVLASDYDRLREQLDAADRMVKNLAPTGRYNGLDIEQWKCRAEAAESELEAVRKLANGWMKCALDMAPNSTMTMVFVPDNPEAFAASRVPVIHKLEQRAEELEAVRKRTIEQCARVCNGVWGETGGAKAARYCEERIRSLTGSEKE